MITRVSGELRRRIKESPRLRRQALRVLSRRDVVDARLLNRVAGSRLLTRAYYATVRTSFADEQHRVARGRRRYMERIGSDPRPRLRRNVHRLEKGLVMRPRRWPFALGYLKEVIDDLECVLRAGPGDSLDDDIEVRWAFEVLDEYWRCGEPANDEHRRLCERYSSLRTRWAVAPCAGAAPNIPSFRPFAPSDSPPPVSYDQLLQLQLRRRSVRHFAPDLVDPEVIERAVTLGSLAPSACNRVAYRFLLLRGPDAARVAALAGGTGGYAQNIPNLLVVLGDHSAYANERDRHNPYIDASLAVMGLLQALESLGLASCCINWPEVPHREFAIRRTLRCIQPFESVIMLVAVGVPAPGRMVPGSPKKPAEHLLQEVVLSSEESREVPRR